MDIYKINDIAELIEGNSYVGRGIVIGNICDAGMVASPFFMATSALWFCVLTPTSTVVSMVPTDIQTKKPTSMTTIAPKITQRPGVVTRR